ncbi:MAG: N-acetylmuramoyl-L-alanine amidase [Clostridia bacterium]|jgi:N-acetyl-anhydromuramyl-L-alanine amidase AmpD|nr:N-acetylmuramoyl-L-alanine amidase [Clostridia bacterium]MDN5324223.1 N-acetylmuramoyl-L-alanine amidase [Clostridia bacterium]
MVNWQGIVIHHSASPRGFWYGQRWRPVDVELIRSWHIYERGWSDIGYHYVVLPDGQVQGGRPLDRIGAHARAGKRNLTAIGICLIGNFQYDSVSPPQLMGTMQLVKKLQKEYDIPVEKVELHKEIPGSNTLCPGRFFPKKAFYEYLNSG